MPANSINRKTVRDSLTTGLRAVLVGSGLPCDEFYGFNPGDYGGRLCVGFIESGPTNRVKAGDEGEGIATFDDDWTTEAFYNVYILAAYSWPNEAGTLVWDEEDAQERIDLSEKIIADYLANNFGSVTGADFVTYAAQTEMGGLEVGTNYKWERHPLKAVKFYG